jgi:hypothetical protein
LELQDRAGKGCKLCYLLELALCWGKRIEEDIERHSVFIEFKPFTLLDIEQSKRTMNAVLYRDGGEPGWSNIKGVVKWKQLSVSPVTSMTPNFTVLRATIS